MSSAWLSVLAKISVLGISLRPGKIRQLVAEGADHGADLIRIHHRAIQFLGTVCSILVLNLPALAARQALAFFDRARSDLPAVLRPLGFDHVHLVADVDAVGDGLLMRILADHVLPEESVGAVVGRRGQTDQVRVEILQHLAPQVVDRAMALVDDDEVEELGRQSGTVDHRRRLSRLHQLRRVDLLGRGVHLLALEDRVHALDGADADLAVAGHERRGEPLHVVQLDELPVVVARYVGHELLLRLLAEVAGVDEEENALGVGVLEEAVDRGNRRVGLA